MESLRTLRTCRHSFSLSLSGSANGDINQSVDTRAEAVMRHHAGVSADRERWMSRPDAGNILNRGIISRMQFEQDSNVDEFTPWFASGSGLLLKEKLFHQGDAADKNDDSVFMFVAVKHVQVHQLQK